MRHGIRAAIDRTLHDERLIALLPVLAFLCIFAFRAPALFVGDSWLALTAGREVAHHGIPHSEELTFWAAGHDWIDQQWLAQWVMYGGYRAAGYFGVWLLAAACLGAGIVLLAATTRQMGIDVVRGAPVGIVLAAAIFPFSGIRTQIFAFLCFGALMYVLQRAGENRRWAWLLVPVLVLWGNTHGSVLLGVLLVAVWTLYHAYRETGRTRGAYLALAAAALAAPLLTPYGLHIVDYYRSTIGNSAFGVVVTEWQPARLASDQPVSHVFFIALAGSGLLLGALRRHVRAYEWVWLAFLLYGALHSVRFETWFMLTAGLVIVRSGVSAGLPRSPSGVPRVHALVAGVLVFLLVVFLASEAVQPASHFVGKQRRESLAALRAYLEREPGARLFGVEENTDFYLWSIPELRKRVLIDSRFELLTSKQLVRLGRYVGTGGAWRAFLRTHRIDVVGGAGEYRDMFKALRRTGWKAIFHRSGSFLVVRH